MNILVTGGAGFIGSNLILKLLELGHSVVCVDNMNKYYDPELKKDRLALFKDKVRFYEVDISDKKELENIFRKNKIDKICHLAAQAGVRYSLENPFIYGKYNYIGTLNILELAKQHKIMHIVFASTSSIYGSNKNMPFTEDQRVDSPVSIYSASKRACELLAFSYNKLYSINVTCLRFFTVYGPFGRPDMALFKFTKNILANKEIEVFNKGDMKRDFTYVGDIVEGFVKAMDKPMGFEIINLGCGDSVKLMDMIKTLENVLGKKAKLKMMPMQQGDVKETFADITKAKKLLGYAPKVNLEKGIIQFVQWYKEYFKINE